MTSSIRIGVSACLLGEHVRYDGGHKHDRYITDTLGRFFSFVPICPEVECGLPVPREAMQLVGDEAATRLLGKHSRSDFTGLMLDYRTVRVRRMEDERLCGFVFKERSPSCGLTAVPLHESGAAEAVTVGLFAREVILHFPLMPMEEAERLRNHNVRKNFIERVFHFHRAKHR